MTNYMSNEKVTIIHLIVELIKKILYKMSYFPEPYNRNKNEIKVGEDSFNYATKFDLKDLKMQQVSIHQILLKVLLYLA